MSWVGDLVYTGFLLIASVVDEGRGSSSKKLTTVHTKLSIIVSLLEQMVNEGTDWGGMKLAYLIVESKGTNEVKGRTFKIKGIATADAPFAEKVIEDKTRKKDKWEKLSVEKIELTEETWKDQLTGQVVYLSNKKKSKTFLYTIKKTVGKKIFIQYVKNSQTKFDYFRIGEIVFWMHLKDNNNNDVWFNQTDRLSGRGLTDFCNDGKAPAAWRTKWKTSMRGQPITSKEAAKNKDAVVDFAITNKASTEAKSRKSCNKTIEITVNKRAKTIKEKIKRKTLKELIDMIKSKSMASTKKEDLKKLDKMEKEAKGDMLADKRNEYNKWRKKNYKKWKKSLSDTELHKIITDLKEKPPVDLATYFHSLIATVGDVQKTTKNRFTSAPAFDPLPFANQVKRKEHKLYKNLRY